MRSRAARNLVLLVRVRTAVVVLLLAVGFILAVPGSARAYFPDVPAGHPYEAAITDLASRGIIGGYGRPPASSGLPTR